MAGSSPAMTENRAAASTDRRPRETHGTQRRRKSREALFAIGGLVNAFVVHESLPGLHADASFAHIRRDDLGRGVTAVAECLDQIAAGVMQDIAAAPVDEFEKAEYCEAE